MRFATVISIWSFLLFSIPLTAQGHLTKTVSVTPATPLNGKGFVLTMQYHLNSFDEFRGGFFLYEFKHSDTLSFATSLLSVDYAKGFKFKKQQLNRFGYYLGVGLFIGREAALPEIGAIGPEYAIYGLRPFAELEYTLLPQITLISRIGRTFAFSDKASTNLEFVLGARLYFST